MNRVIDQYVEIFSSKGAFYKHLSKLSREYHDLEEIVDEGTNKHRIFEVLEFIKILEFSIDSFIQDLIIYRDEVLGISQSFFYPKQKSSYLEKIFLEMNLLFERIKSVSDIIKNEIDDFEMKYNFHMNIILEGSISLILKQYMDTTPILKSEHLKIIKETRAKLEKLDILEFEKLADNNLLHDIDFHIYMFIKFYLSELNKTSFDIYKHNDDVFDENNYVFLVKEDVLCIPVKKRNKIRAESVKVLESEKTVFIEYFGEYIKLKDRINFSKIINRKEIGSNKICFLGKQNILAELFKRMYYNEVLLVEDMKRLADWIVESFENKNGKLNRSTVYNVLTKTDLEPPEDKIILKDLYPYIPKESRKREK